MVEDYSEQVLTTCIPTGQCPTCKKPHNELGEFNPNEVSELRDLSNILGALYFFNDNPGDFLKTCKEAGIKPVIDPFRKELPYANIYWLITPNILHQLYQGVLKHLVEWVKQSCGVVEVGQEHDQISRILLGLVIDCPQPGGLSNVRLVRAVRALLDFVFLAQYPIHTNETLILLNDALERFHDNKNIFIDLGI